METRRVYEYVWLGAVVRHMVRVEAGVRVKGPDGLLTHARNGEGLLDGLKLTVTKRAWVNDLQPISKKWSRLPAEYVLSDTDADALRAAMKIIEAVLINESQTKFGFFPSEKRYELSKLLDGVDGLFGPGVYAKLPLLAADDFRDAGRAIAFSLPTAAAFHALRGTEAVLRDFYKSRVARNRVKPLLWGPIVTSLRALRTPPEAALLANLENIRVSFRNPTAHPDKTYDIEEAQDLLSLCIEAVNRMNR